jgi:hypothetical protein
MLALLFFLSLLHRTILLTSHFEQHKRAHIYIYTINLCVVRVRFFYVNKTLFFCCFSLILSFFLRFVRVCEHTYMHSQHTYTRVEGKKTVRERQWGQRLAVSALSRVIESERERENSWDDVNIPSSFVLLMLLFLLIHDITNHSMFIFFLSVLLI